eukprot:TRINITY_DN27434_c0_g1_i1.p1 TRINITY_DN27434_c0_g1~~TRINITY_DN27434_c0_g1_i1.p1  ORF type:complete len:302 (+),score=38.60 TRINITY_DN27434_c0_g1_i1:22-906(+)
MASLQETRVKRAAKGKEKKEEPEPTLKDVIALMSNKFDALTTKMELFARKVDVLYLQSGMPTSPPIWEPAEWRVAASNCYAYAANDKYPGVQPAGSRLMPLPGRHADDSGTKVVKWVAAVIADSRSRAVPLWLAEDLEGKPRGTASLAAHKPEGAGYMIIMLRSTEGAIHFVRQDLDERKQRPAGWSHFDGEADRRVGPAQCDVPDDVKALQFTLDRTYSTAALFFVHGYGFTVNRKAGTSSSGSSNSSYDFIDLLPREDEVREATPPKPVVPPTPPTPPTPRIGIWRTTRREK